jgi:hypothetical protein
VIDGGRMVRLRLSEDEKRYVIAEVAERIRDLIFMNAYNKTEEAINKLLENVKDEDVKSEYEFCISFNYSFIVNDLVQIVGRYRRGREE